MVMKRKNLLMGLGIVILFLFVLTSFSGSSTQSVYDRDTLSECNDRRQDKIYDGFKCVGECQLITSDHVSCRGIDSDEVGNYAFFADSDDCEEAFRDQDDFELWNCFYDEGLIWRCVDDTQNRYVDESSMVSDNDQYECYGYLDNVYYDDGVLYKSFFYCDSIFHHVCEEGCNYDTGRCGEGPRVCDEGEEVCDGSTIKECVDNEWTTKQTCSGSCLEVNWNYARCTQDYVYYCLSGSNDCTTLETSNPTPPDSCYTSLLACKNSKVYYCVENNECKKKTSVSESYLDEHLCFSGTDEDAAEASCTNALDDDPDDRKCQDLSKFGDKLSRSEAADYWCEVENKDNCISFHDLKSLHSLDISDIDGSWFYIFIPNLPGLIDYKLENFGVCVYTSSTDRIIAWVMENWFIIAMAGAALFAFSILKP